MEFDSIIAAVNSGKADFGMAGMTVTPERQQEIDFTDTYCTAAQSIIVLKGEESGSEAASSEAASSEAAGSEAASSEAAE